MKSVFAKKKKKTFILSDLNLQIYREQTRNSNFGFWTLSV